MAVNAKMCQIKVAMVILVQASWRCICDHVVHISSHFVDHCAALPT